MLERLVVQGAKFDELEYMHMLDLMHRSRPGFDPERVKSHLQQLAEYFMEQRTMYDLSLWMICPMHHQSMLLGSQHGILIHIICL